ncbi:MAG: signal peptidase II [Bacteriovorax sp.]|jgi:signal peptidase II|nr:signal peptidase II [Bacteriovorax sp.]
MNRIFKMSVMIAAIIILDQITKGIVQQKFALGESIPVISNFFHLTYVRNPGAAFGMFAYAPDYIRTPLFLILPVVACFWLLSLIWKSRNENFYHCLAYSLIFSGAVGNLIDRFSMNYVVDFFDFFIGTNHFPAFNIADSSISIAAFILVIDLLFFSKNNELKKEKSVSSNL